MKKKSHSFDTSAIHIDHTDQYHALVPPIYMTSTFTFKNMKEADEIFNQEKEGCFYTRGTNPTLSLFEQQMAKLEQGAHAVSFSSGMAAVSSVLMSLVKQGDDVIAHRNLYGCSYIFMEKILSKFGVKVHFENLLDLSQFEKTITPKTKVIYFETPTNPSLEIIDIVKVAEIAKKHGIKTVVDNTFATPYFQKPLLLGIDIVLHSVTKYISGHGDLVGGAVIANDKEYMNKLKFEYMCKLGGLMSPFNAWLLLRGIKTLGVRMRQHEENTKAIVEFLSHHPKIEKVMYPGLSTHHNHDIAKKQMSGFGSMISFECAGDQQTAFNVVENVKMIKLAVSLGDTETLIEIPSKMTHRDLPEADYYKFGLTNKTIRLSVGLENAQDIIDDLNQALMVS